MVCHPKWFCQQYILSDHVRECIIWPCFFRTPFYIWSVQYILMVWTVSRCMRKHILKVNIEYLYTKKRLLILQIEWNWNLHCTLLVFSSNFPVSKNLSNEVGMKKWILLLILAKIYSFAGHFRPLGAKLRPCNQPCTKFEAKKTYLWKYISSILQQTSKIMFWKFWFFTNLRSLEKKFRVN